MKDPTSEILSAFITALNGNLTYSGENFKVIKNLHKVKSFKHVLLKDVDVVDDSPNDHNSYECTIAIQVLDSGAKQKSDNTRLNSISNQIQQRIGRVALSLTSYTMTVEPVLTGIDDHQEVLDENEIHLSKQLNYRFRLQEK